MEERDIWRRRRIRKFRRALRRTAIVCLCAACLAGLLYLNQFSLNLKIVGNPDIYVEYGEKYEEYGAKCYLTGRYLFRQGIEVDIPVEIKTDLNESRIGRYGVTYQAKLAGLKGYSGRNVWVVDTVCPQIMLIGETTVSDAEGLHYQEEGYMAYDNHDGDITHKVVRTEQEGRILYGVADSSGNPAYAVRIVPNFDPVKPEIMLAGEEHIRLEVGRGFVEPGFTARDNVDGDLTEYVEVFGTVDCFKPGLYPIVYSVTDSASNRREVTRIVEVVRQELPETKEPEGKVIYLTFDDGPSQYTRHLLSVLEKYGVKATFFVVGDENPAVLRQIVEGGHSIGIHTMTHVYHDIYASPEAFFADLYGKQDVIREATGVNTKLMRFPGGSSNTVSSNVPGLMTILTQAVQDAGFRYFDWNVDSMDAGGAKSVDEVCTNVISGIRRQDISVVLQHDIYAFSVGAVEEIILWGLENGYTFLPLEMDSPVMEHTVRN